MMRHTPFPWPAALLFLLSTVADASLVAQSYRRLDVPGQVVTLPAAVGLPSITSIAAAPGGGFSILHTRAGNIHHFDANGRLLKRYGRVSDSTAKIERLSVHGWHGSMPWAHERNSRQILMFDGRTALVSTTIDMPRHGPAMVESITPDGAPVVYHYFRQPEGATPQYRYGYAVLPGFGMAPKSGFAMVPPDECFVTLGSSWVPVPWCQRSQGVVAPNGEWVAVVTEAPQHVRSGAAVVVKFLSTRGDTMSSVRIEAPRIPVAATVVASQLTRESRSRQLSHDNTLKLRSAVAAEPHYPIANWLIATNDRTVWLVQQTASATHYIVVNTEGREVGRYSTAANLRLMAVAGRTAFGVRTLANGGEQVVRVVF